LKQPSQETAIVPNVAVDEYLMNVYTRLARYQTAAQDSYNHATGTPTRTEQYKENDFALCKTTSKNM